MERKQIHNYLLAFGHLCSDINQGALSAILPFLIAAHHYSYTTAATLVMVANIVASVVQPVFGQIADKKSRPWIMAAGIFLAGGGMAATGFIPQFYGLCAAVMLSGIGTAMFHPQAAKLVNQASTENNKGKNISIFSFGGNLGFTFGPILAAASITWFGLRGTAVFLLPAMLLCAVLTVLSRTRKDLLAEANAGKTAATAQGIDQWPSFCILTAVAFGRSIVLCGFNTFLALYWIRELGQSEVVSNSILSVFYAIGAASTLCGGRLADAVGYHKVVRISFSILLPSIMLLTLSHNVYLATLALVPLGCALSMSYSPMVVLGQKYLPNRVGLASGVTLGLAVSVGGIVAPLLGSVADRFGLVSVLHLLAVIAVIPLIAAYLLPQIKQAHPGRKALSKVNAAKG